MQKKIMHVKSTTKNLRYLVVATQYIYSHTYRTGQPGQDWYKLVLLPLNLESWEKEKNWSMSASNL